MALEDAISINEGTRPVVTKQLLDFRNDSMTVNGETGKMPSQSPVDITGYTFELVIKRQPVGFRVQDGYPQVYDSDTYATRYDGTIVSATDGTFKFTLDDSITSCYGEYPAEIRWWKSGDSTSAEPTDRVMTQVLINRVLDSTY